MTEIIKWAGFVVLTISTALNCYNIYPLGPIVGILGGILWLIGGIRMKDGPLIATNAVLLGISVITLTLKLYSSYALSL